MKMNTISASKARDNFYKILEDVKDGLKSYSITLRGEVQAIIMNPEEVAEWEETVEILSDKKLVAQILKSQQEKMDNEYISEEKLLNELNISKDDFK
jgi:PHD/YefM family antitoxin component YafN of YafNO toxin-antitoxin module